MVLGTPEQQDVTPYQREMILSGKIVCAELEISANVNLQLKRGEPGQEFF